MPTAALTGSQCQEKVLTCGSSKSNRCLSDFLCAIQTSMVFQYRFVGNLRLREFPRAGPRAHDTAHICKWMESELSAATVAPSLHYVWLLNVVADCECDCVCYPRLMSTLMC